MTDNQEESGQSGQGLAQVLALAWLVVAKLNRLVRTIDEMGETEKS